jgi:hypothetical protein
MLPVKLGRQDAYLPAQVIVESGGQGNPPFRKIELIEAVRWENIRSQLLLPERGRRLR